MGLDALNAMAEAMGRMTLNWIVDDNGVPHEWHGHPVDWSRWMHENKAPGGLAVVGRCEWADGTRVSTVFLGIDLGFGMGAPLFWETMVFWPDGDERERPQERYHSQRDALSGHREWVATITRMKGADDIAFQEAWTPPEQRLSE